MLHAKTCPKTNMTRNVKQKQSNKQTQNLANSQTAILLSKASLQ